MPHNLNIWNPGRVDALLSEAADGNALVERFLKLALRKPLLAHMTAVRTLETLPENAPGWLRAKFGAAAFHEFDPALDPGLEDAVAHVRDWIAGAVSSDADWTKEDKPRRLLHFRTVDDAVQAADRAVAEENARLKNLAPDGGGETETVMTLEGGFRIVRLLSPAALDRESVRMGHCIGNGGYDEKLRKNTHIYYSLRDTADRPHATMEAEAKSNILRQCKGKQNVPPVETYFPFIRAFVEREKFVLKENPGYTGLWQAPDGAYHSVRKLPPGAKIEGSLDVSGLSGVVLPENLTVTLVLILNGASPPACPPGLKTFRVDMLWRKRGKFHREDGPAVAVLDPLTFNACREEWFRDGELHRENGPAVAGRHGADSTVTTWEIWCREGLRHRRGGPAITKRDPQTGATLSEIWYENGKYHRDGGPAVVVYDPETGAVKDERWFCRGNKVPPPAASPSSKI